MNEDKIKEIYWGHVGGMITLDTLCILFNKLDLSWFTKDDVISLVKHLKKDYSEYIDKYKELIEGEE